MNSIAGVITLALVLVVRLNLAQQIGPLRCYNCVTDYQYGVQDPQCPISEARISSCPVEVGLDRCISYRAFNTRKGKMTFRRHCATRQMCEYQCLFYYHTNCQKACCQDDLCNDVNFGTYEVTTGKPQQASTTTTTDTPPNPTTTPIISQDPTIIPNTPHNPTTTPIISQNPTTTPVITQNPLTPKSDPTEGSQSTSEPTEIKTTTNAPVTTRITMSTTPEEPLVGGPPTRPGCQDYREECSQYAAYPGYCQYTRSFMLIHCPRSCRYCGGGSTRATTARPTRSATTRFETTSARTTLDSGSGVGGPSGCVDAREECIYFAGFDGYCQYHYGFMLTYCPRACDLCDEIELPQSPLKNPTTEQAELTTNEPEVLPKATPFGPGGEDYENGGCIDLRENCTFFATTYDDYCNYNQDFMEIYCPFSCGFCGTTVPDLAFPHPPIIRLHKESGEAFPPPPGKKDVRWLSFFCNECENGSQECHHKCILILKNGIYEPTSNDVCMELLGKPNENQPC